MTTVHVPIWDILNLHARGDSSTLELQAEPGQKLHALLNSLIRFPPSIIMHLSLPIYIYSCLLFTPLQQDDAYSDLLCNLEKNVKQTAFKKKKKKKSMYW